MKRVVRTSDFALTAVAVLAALYMALHRPSEGVNDLLPGGRPFAAIGLFSAGLVAFGLITVLRRPLWMRALLRVTLFGLTLLLVLAARGRVKAEALEKAGQALNHWPPRAEDSRAARVDDLKSAARASWAAHLVAHRAGATIAQHGPIDVPADWPFPADIQIAVRARPGTAVEIWARAKDGAAFCLPIPAIAPPSDSARQRRECEKQQVAPAGLEFASPLRATESPASASDVRLGSSWTEYRADGRKSGAAKGEHHGAGGWRSVIDGPIRSSAVVVGDVVLVGAHGTGAFAALDLATGHLRWTTYLPNWVHQDPVSDGQIVVVGFGDNTPSMAGEAPSGVAAYDLQSGRRLWTHFEETSVMTSPILRDSTVTYASAAGVLRTRSLRSGALLAMYQLPGGVIMGPPASTGDTILLGLDVHEVCAVEMSQLKPIWCRSVPGLIKVGHAGPTITNGTAIISGTSLLRGISLAEFGRLPLHAELDAVWTMFGPDATLIGQKYMAFDLHSGRALWQSRLFPSTRDVEGHISGTAAIAAGTGAIVLPISDTLVAFNPATGAPLWTAGARGTRGAPLIVDGRVVLAGHDGVIDVRDLLTGALTCSLHRAVGYDRAGPTLAGDLVIFANLRGMVEAIPTDDVLHCREAAPPSTANSGH